jgi:hypothetical protein
VISSLAKELVLECFYRVWQNLTSQVLTGDPEEVGTQRTFQKIKGQKLMAKGVFLVR